MYLGISSNPSSKHSISSATVSYKNYINCYNVSQFLKFLPTPLKPVSVEDKVQTFPVYGKVPSYLYGF